MNRIDVEISTKKIDLDLVQRGIQGPAGAQGPAGRDGFVQLTPGPGIIINDGVISASPFSVSTISVNGNYRRFLPIDGAFMIYANNAFPDLNSYTNAIATNFPFAGTILKFTVTSIANASNGTDTLTIYKNGIATALTITVANGQRTGTITGSVSFVADTDFFAVAYTGDGNFNDWRITTEISPS